ncbi:hypothetical protein Salat_0146800 [Sesamum alatum]|uniref:Uncharacterized protein n=1 Tax=Sesamum alatum TaxID=300844 RepID=A0AAE1YXY1_9LAMI|nr:hypothetical protein Salat_0146800 [Sesamum alatum]
MREGSSKLKRQQTTVKCGKCGLQEHTAKGCPGKDVRTNLIPDASSQVQPNFNVIQVTIKGKGIMQEPEVPLHARTRSGHIGGVEPVIRKPKKLWATTPTIFNNSNIVNQVPGHRKRKGVLDQPLQ